jgi:hypothetical protein
LAWSLVEDVLRLKRLPRTIPTEIVEIEKVKPVDDPV